MRRVTGDAEVGLQTRLLPGLFALQPGVWNGLLSSDDAPFLDERFLRALEESGCVAPETGWTPQHLTVWKDGSLVGAAPAYIKQDSDGDFGRDWAFADAAMRARIRYFPKLVLGIPFTPITGRRLLCVPTADAALTQAIQAALVGAARSLLQTGAVAVVQVLFPTEDELRVLQAAGFLPRIDFQYHWQNPGYSTPADFYARFTAKRRHMLLRERGAAAKQDITVRTLCADELRHDPILYADLLHTLHSTTVDKLVWGRRWLSQAFYRRLFQTMIDPLELVLAEHQGRPIAGAFNVYHAGAKRLYGRYWGCIEEHPFLHFHVSYYHTIEACIRRGLGTFEGGAGGEHKIARGFEPAKTYSAYAVADARLADGLARHLVEENAQRHAALAHFFAHDTPLRPLGKIEAAAE